MKKTALWFFACVAALALGFAPTAVAEDADLEPIEIELPDAFFGGTPLPYWSPNLEEYDYRDRPPFLAPAGTENVALGKPVTSSVAPLHGELEQITNGDKHYARTSLVELPAGVQWVQIDLEKEHDIYAILVWHFHEGDQVYFDIVVQVSNDPEFNEDVVTIYNNDHDNSSGLGVGEDNEYIECHRGRLMDADGVSARYVRLYSNGNTANDFNHYIEVEVYALPST